jgi:hypothetical protein
MILELFRQFRCAPSRLRPGCLVRSLGKSRVSPSQNAPPLLETLGKPTEHVTYRRRQPPVRDFAACAPNSCVNARIAARTDVAI